MARFYEIDPAAVNKWTSPEFLDRQEFMFYQIHLDRQELKKAAK